ncbi:S8 family serine peptidase, partial [Nocardioides sp.]|uniref:S8 family serine peptidase n=1 Tax=Nocardioides sp. TaxID=35761 RepID=UPI002736151E
MSVAGLLLVAVGAVVPLGLAAPSGAQPDAPAESTSCDAIGVDDAVSRTTAASLPLEALAIERTHERLTARRPPGSGVTVAVVDSGVAPGNGRIEVSRAVNLVGGGPLVSGHGTIVAGLIAGAPRPDGGGLVGVAPGAAIVSVRVL